jgi:hypothetical protein
MKPPDETAYLGQKACASCKHNSDEIESNPEATYEGQRVSVTSRRLVLLDLSVFGYLVFEYSLSSGAG